MNKITITLKQHTPLLHFQPMQEGATLRASEVKPKLDKFLLKKLGGDVKKEWFIGDTNSLNYKMRIDAGPQLPQEFLVASYLKKDYIDQLERNGINVLSNTPFFAQEKQNGNICKNISEWNNIEKKGVLFKNPIEIQILTKSENLAQAICDNIQAFFLSLNFGTRQTKGFGSFTVTRIQLNLQNTDQQIELQDNETVMKSLSSVVCRSNRTADTNLATIFSNINNDYKLLKSGLNRPYRKSILRNYIDETYHIKWEKRFIKRYFEGQFCDEQENEYKLKSNNNKEVYYKNNEKYNYIRAMLGLAEQFEFLLDRSKDKMILKLKPTDKSIERFASPLTFKVIDGNVYILVNDIPNEILNRTFDCLVSFKNDKAYENESIGNIKTLSSFSLPSFMEYACNTKDFGYSIL